MTPATNPSRKNSKNSHGLLPKHPVEAPADDAPDNDRGDQLGRHAHAVGHAAPAHLGIEIGVRFRLTLRLDLAELGVEVGDPPLELGSLLGGHFPRLTALLFGRIRHETGVLGGSAKQQHPLGPSNAAAPYGGPPGVSRNAGATNMLRPVTKTTVAQRCDNWTVAAQYFSVDGRRREPASRRDGELLRRLQVDRHEPRHALLAW